MLSPDWMASAACRGQATTWWYPNEGQPPDPRALEVCGACEVRDDCLAYAMRTFEKDGVWGGLTVEQRRALRRRRARAGRAVA